GRIERLRPEVMQRIGPQHEPDGPERWALAARVREIAGDAPGAIAETYHCGAWCARLLGDREREKRLLEQAIPQYQRALEPPSRPDGQRGYFTYEIAELLRRVGRTDEAAAWYAKVPQAASLDMLPKYNATLVRRLAQSQAAEPRD